jgi:hypothetical protein
VVEGRSEEGLPPGRLPLGLGGRPTWGGSLKPISTCRVLVLCIFKIFHSCGKICSLNHGVLPSHLFPIFLYTKHGGDKSTSKIYPIIIRNQLFIQYHVRHFVYNENHSE